MVPRGDGSEATFNPDQWMEPKDQRKVDDFIIYAMSAAKQALDDANWHPSSEEEKCATGTLIGSGIGGLSGIADTAILLKERGPRKVSPFFIPGPPDQPCLGLCLDRARTEGPQSFRRHRLLDRRACDRRRRSTDRARRCRRDGGRRLGIAGLPDRRWRASARARALSTGYNETPEKASRPYDKDRDGFVMGEGAGVVVLEEYEHAKRRGAKIYAEVIGYGLSGDAYHITSPSPDGDGAFRSMAAAMKRAGISAVRHRLHQRARHLDAARRRDRTRRGRAAARQRGLESVDVLDQIVHRTFAWRGRRDRGDLLHPGDSR